MNQNRLAAKVAAQNKANAEANRLVPLFVALFTEAVGQKVFKTDGSLAKKWADRLPASNQTLYKRQSNYSLGFCVKADAEVDGRTHYAEQGIHVGEVSDGVLTKLNPSDPVPVDYDAQVIAELRVTAERLKEQARHAENACHPFGLFD